MPRPYSDYVTPPVRAVRHDAPSRWLWLVGLVGLALWWPRSTYWLSDDWICVHYAADLGRALSDFWHNQYDLPGVVWFYRPLVTLSFALEQILAGGPSPFVSHLSNAVALGLSSALLARLVALFFGNAAGLFAGLAFAAAPVHAGSVAWACGRTGAHSEVWLLAALNFATEAAGSPSRRRMLGGLACFALALLTKETAMALPGLVFVLALAAAAPGTRTARAVRVTVPFAALLVVYLVWRWFLFGRLGGYQTGPIEPLAAARGLGGWTARLATPTLSLHEQTLLDVGLDASWLHWAWAGAVPAALAALLWLRARPRALLALVALYLAAAVPLAPFWSLTDNPHDLRVYTLPCAALAALLARHALTALPWLAVCALPQVEVHAHYRDAYIVSARVQRLVADQAAGLPEGPVLVAGLPREVATHDVVLFQNGVDRLLAPPFGDGRHRVLALRPLSGAADAPRIPYGEESGAGPLPTLALVQTTGCVLLPPARLPALSARIEGTDHLSTQALLDINTGRADPAFVLDGPRQSHYRVTVFTAGGYVTCVLENRAPTDQGGGRLPLREWLTAYTSATQGVVQDLAVPTALDLSLRFPVWIEGGSMVQGSAGGARLFAPSHAARDVVWVAFDRDYAVFMGLG